MKKHILCILLAAIGLVVLVRGQNFDPNLEDEEYLNQVDRRVKHEVVTAKQELFDTMEGVRLATRAYIGAKIKHNLFKVALKTLAEKELETMSMQNRPRQPRQEDDEVESTTETGLIPQLATIVQSIFGKNVNATKYVQSASQYLPSQIGTPLVGVVSLLDPSHFTSTTPRAPGRFNFSSSYNTTNSDLFPNIGGAKSKPVSGGAFPNKNKRQPQNEEEKVDEEDEEESDIEESDEDDDEERRRTLLNKRVKRQFNFNHKGLNPMLLVDGLEAIWTNMNKKNETSTTPVTQYAKAQGAAGTKVRPTTESEDGFDDDYTTKPSRITNAVNGVAGVMTHVEALRKGVPDLLQGAREAYKFLEHLNGFLDTWEARLQAGAGDDDE